VNTFEVEELRRSAPWIQEAECLQVERNMLTVLHRGERGPVKDSSVGGLTFGSVAEPEETADGILRVASLRDLFATKLNTLLPPQALCYFQEPSLRDLPELIKTSLVQAVQSVC
jgi:hypothetical protein